MTRNKLILVGVTAVILVAAMAVKWFFFPSVKDSYFTLNGHVLRQAPSGMVVVRPSPFSPSSRSGIVSAPVEASRQRAWRFAGRNVSFKQLISFAYGHTEGRVQLPVIAPTNHFDFLVTCSGDYRQQLQKAIRKKLGYVAKMENRDTEVLALKVKNGALPGLVVSDPGAKQNVDFRNGRLYFTHMQVGTVTGGVEQLARLPVVDKTDLTNYYDFSTAWGPQVQRQLQNENTARATLEKILGDWGLGLESDVESVEMLVVKSAS